MYKRKKILAIVCAYNEESKVSSTIKKIHKDLVDTILVVDDGSNDNTVSEAKEAGAVVISHKKNTGVGAALKTGFKYAIKNNFDICLITAGDNQDDQNDARKLVSTLVDENYDLVSASRYLGGTKNMTLFRFITTRIYTTFFNLMTGAKMTDATNGFRAIKIDLVKKVNIWQEWLNRYELEPYLLWYAIKNYKVKEIPTLKRFDLVAGFSKMKMFVDWWKITRPIVFLKLGIKK